MKYVSWRILAVILWLIIAPEAQAQRIVGEQIDNSVFADSKSAIVLYDVATATRLPANGRIVFVMSQEGVSQLFSMNADGTNLQQLTSGGIGAISPTWSPNGDEIAYINLGTGVTIMRADGVPLYSLPNTIGIRDLAWSPTRNELVGATSSGLVLIDIITGDQTSVPIEGFSESAYHEEPDWSPDGNKIVFVSSGTNYVPRAIDGNPSMDLYIIDRDGGSPTRLGAFDAEGFGGVTWGSADRIFFSAQTVMDAQLIKGVFIYHIATEELVLLTTPAFEAYYSALAPDEGSVAFVDGSRTIFVVNLDGSNPAAVATLNESARDLDWQPVVDHNPATPLPLSANGRLMFTMEQAGVAQLFSINTDGTDLVQITSNPEGAYSPSWSPDGTQIAFSNRYGLVVMQANGTSSYMVSSGQFLSDSHWSPTRNELVAVGSYDLAIVDLTLDTASVLSIAEFTPGAFNQNPAWSPTGDALVFASTGTNPIQSARDGDPLMDLYTIGRDGVGVRKLDNINASYYGGLNWTSSDIIIFSARKIIEAQLIDGIFSYDLLADTLTLLSNPAEDAVLPSVSPDETKIAFVQGLRTIMIMNIDGSHATTVATLNANVRDLDWQSVNVR